MAICNRPLTNLQAFMLREVIFKDYHMRNSCHHVCFTRRNKLQDKNFEDRLPSAHMHCYIAIQLFAEACMTLKSTDCTC